MTEQLYRIKPLVWTDRDDHSFTFPRCVDSLYTAYKTKLVIREVITTGFNMQEMPVSTLQEAKEAAEAHYRRRLMEALEPVDGMQFRDIGEFRRDLEEFGQRGQSND